MKRQVKCQIGGLEIIRQSVMCCQSMGFCKEREREEGKTTASFTLLHTLTHSLPYYKYCPLTVTITPTLHVPSVSLTCTSTHCSSLFTQSGTTPHVSPQDPPHTLPHAHLFSSPLLISSNFCLLIFPFEFGSL